MGKVYLVGAGPGRADLLTLKAYELIKRADVILYDELIGDVVEVIKNSNAELINVGKRRGHHRMTQTEINKLMVELARRGKIVVRLKGGDPFIFGRGGEEAQYLAEHGVEFEVVPGVTSAIAVPAIAGIPLTHRDYDPAVVIMTGTEVKERINWESLAKFNATIVVLMGVKNLDKISKNLIKYGKNPNTPVAVIERGYSKSQRIITGFLSNISDIAKREDVRPPSVIVIGDVVNFREKLIKVENYKKHIPEK